MIRSQPEPTWRVLVLATGLVACSEGATEPRINLDRPPVVMLETETAAALSIGATDVVDRVLPVLDDSPERPALQAAVNSLTAVSSTRSVEELNAAAIRLSSAFAGYAASKANGLIDPELGAVRVLLDHVLSVSANPPLDTLQVK